MRHLFSWWRLPWVIAVAESPHEVPDEVTLNSESSR